MTTLLALKNRKAELRSIMIVAKKDGQRIDEEIHTDYQTVIDQLAVAEEKLLKPVDKCARCKHLHEKQ